MPETHRYGPIVHGAPARFSRADLEFYSIDHFRPSFTALIYFNDAEVDEHNATTSRPSYAGSFSIFGHRFCSGDEGHCDVHDHGNRFDDRPSHPLTPAFKRVMVTEALRRVQEAGQPELYITVVCFAEPDQESESTPLLEFTGMQLALFD
jgi:hypothetical protein